MYHSWQNLVLLADKCDRCDEQAICVNGTCECKQGFVGNGFTCIGECLQSKAKFVTFRVEVFCISPWFLSAVGNPCQPNPCENGGTCNPGHGGKLFECVCKEGFSGSKCEGGNVWMIAHFIRWVHLTRAFRLQVGSNVHMNIAQNNIATARCTYGYSTCKLNVPWAPDIVFFERIRICSNFLPIRSLQASFEKKSRL